MKVEWGSQVWLKYDLLLDSGDQIDSSEKNGPLQVRVGEWGDLPGLGRKLVGLQEGDERLIRLAPSEAFGDWDLNAVLTVQESRLVGDRHLDDGTRLRIETDGGATAICRVCRVGEDRVAPDFNHPYAGQALSAFIRVESVLPPAAGNNRMGDECEAGSDQSSPRSE